MRVYLTPPPGNPLTRAIAAVLAVVLLIGAFMVGMVAFLAVLGISLVVGLWLWIKNWLALRKAGRSGEAERTGHTRQQGSPGRAGRDAIEGEFTVISRDENPRD